jgi:hypothetical protein
VKQIRKITGNFKGFTSFILLFVFLYSGIIRSSIIDVPSLASIERHHVSPSTQKQFAAISGEDLNQRQLTQFKKVDTDQDDEITLFKNSLVSLCKTGHSAKKKTISKFDSFHSIAKLPLYDLFCNWKFHLL